MNLSMWPGGELFLECPLGECRLFPEAVLANVWFLRECNDHILCLEIGDNWLQEQSLRLEDKFLT